MKNIVFVLLFFLLVPLLNADEKNSRGKVYSETFKTSNTHDGFRPPPSVSMFGSSFQKSLKVLPENMLVTSVLFLINSKEGVHKNQKNRLYNIFQKNYSDILKDKQMTGISSALPYCLSDKKPNYGHLFSSSPEKN